MERFAYLYVLDTLSDWEPGYAIAELHSGRFFKEPGRRVPVRTVGVGTQPVTTMGGVEITPEVLVSDVSPGNTAVLLLAGADIWGEAQHDAVLHKAEELLDAGANVAAICGATGALANTGVFDDRPHTSNSPQYLEMVAPNYRGQAHYVDARAVADGNLITADSSGQLLWAKHILERLGVLSDESLEAWYRYFDTGDAQHFFALMQSLPQ
jgi:putative intracellular protease/amidase